MTADELRIFYLHGLSQRFLAEATGIPRSTLQSILKGTASEKTLERLEKVNIYDVLTKAGERQGYKHPERMAGAFAWYRAVEPITATGQFLEWMMKYEESDFWDQFRDEYEKAMEV